MDIDRDDGDERPARRDGMIREFQDARHRRLVIDAHRPAAAPAHGAVLRHKRGASPLVVQDDGEQ